jgi:hypothetical protein
LSFAAIFLNFHRIGTLWCYGAKFVGPPLSQVKITKKLKLEEQMKFNKWTLGLAALGIVSLASAVRADESTPTLVPLNTAISKTVISGYVDAAAQYNTGNNGPSAAVPTGLSNGKVDNFTLNSLDIALDKPEDETPWAAGYHAELNAGVDAVGVSLNNANTAYGNGTYNLAIRQAYVTLRTPVGNGIDWKIGVQDDIIGYEGNTDGGNPNYTRSVGYSLEPTTLVGLVGSYKIVDAVTVQAGLANADTANPWGYSGAANGGNTSSDKTFAAAVAFTAPDSFGWAKGATLNLGTLLNVDKGGQDNWYAGLTVPTPITALKVGAAFDYVSANNAGDNYANDSYNPKNDSGWVTGLYATVQATDKLSFNLRGEYFDLPGATAYTSNYYWYTDGQGEEVTATISYNLWANVISRLEFRWDHIDSGTAFSNTGGDANAFVLAANFIYTF